MIAIKLISITKLPDKCEDCPMLFLSHGDKEVCEAIESLNHFNCPEPSHEANVLEYLKEGTKPEHCPLIETYKYTEMYMDATMEIFRLRMKYEPEKTKEDINEALTAIVKNMEEK